MSVASELSSVPNAPAPTTMGGVARVLSPAEERIALALIRAALPAVAPLPGGDWATLARLRTFWIGLPSEALRGYAALLWTVESASLVTDFKPFSRLNRDRAEAFLDDWSNGRLHLARTLVRAVLTPIKYAHFDAPEMFNHVGCAYGVDAPKVDEQPRWMAQVSRGEDLADADVHGETIELEAEVVIVGTGAGGAAAAYELARRGRAVLMLEEGDYHRRSSFTGRASEMTRRLYRDAGLTIAWGNVGIPVWAGRGVGGTTLVNSGTCYRAPERVFARWRERYGLTGFSADSMAPYYAQVEAMLQVAPAARAHLGGSAAVVERGARKLGLLHHGPLSRNAPDCDGQGLCCFGCPTGAKRSTDVSYVPEALKRGAQLITGARVDRVDIVAGKARGVHGTFKGGRKFRVRADATVIAAGTMYTPLILRRSGLTAPMIGRNLSIHPATKVIAEFDERIDPARGIPQSYAIEDFAADGLMLEGASTPFDVMSISIPYVGRRLMEIMANFQHVATFGLMVQDTARGVVREGPGGRPLMTYDMNRHDLERMRRGVAKVCEVFLAAGAKRTLPFVAGIPEVRNARDVRALSERAIRPGDIEVTAYHPLGTARIGCDPRTSVVRPDYETHEIASLFVTDGAAVPSSLGVNPQLTIMAMALRGAEAIDRRLG